MPGLRSTRPAPDLPPGPRAALVIATSAYDDKQLSQLRAPARDADELAQVLADPDIANFTVTSLINQSDTQIRRGIGKFLAGRGADDLILVYFSCHGLLNKRGNLYFAASDTAKDQLGSTAVSSGWLLNELDECRAQRQVLILDCCFSAAFARGSKGDMDLEQRLTGHGRGRAVLTASRGGEYSFEGRPLPGQAVPGSVFTAALIEGISTGRADANGDGHITLDEAYSYAFEQVQRDGKQTPQRWLYGAEGSFVLARNPAGISIEPASIPLALQNSLDSQYPGVRIGAVNTLAGWLADEDPGRALIAYRTLQEIARNDAPVVAAAANDHLRASTLTADIPPRRPPAPPAEPPRATEPAPETPVEAEGEPEAEPDAVADGEAGTAIPMVAAAAPAASVGTDVPAAEQARPGTGDVRAAAQDGVPPDAAGSAVRAVGEAGLADRKPDVPVEQEPARVSQLNDSSRPAAPTAPVAGKVPQPAGTVSESEVFARERDTPAAGAPSTADVPTASRRGRPGSGLDDHSRSPRRSLIPIACAILVAAVAVPLALVMPGAVRHPSLSDTAAKTRTSTPQLSGPLKGTLTVTLTAGASHGVTSVAFGPGGTTLAAADRIGSTYLWGITARKITATLPDPFDRSMYSVAFRPSGTTLAATDANGSTYLWDTTTQKTTAALPDPNSGGVTSVAFGPRGTTLAATDANGSIYLWDITTRKITAALPDPNSGGVTSVAFEPGGTTLAAGDGNGKTYLWDTTTRKITAALADPNSGGVTSVAFEPGGTTLAAGDGNGKTYLWDTTTRKITAALPDPNSQGVTSVAFGPGTTLAAADVNGSIYLWRLTRYNP
jgi:Caspase domain/WD domain, G-beta repeat